MKQKILYTFLITIISNLLFSQVYVEKKYFHDLGGANPYISNPTGSYHNKLMFIHTLTNEFHMVDGINEPIILENDCSFALEDNFKTDSSAGWAREFIIDEYNNIIDIGVQLNIGSFKDITKDSEGNYFFINSDGKIFAYDQEGSHLELFDIGDKLFKGITVQENNLIVAYGSDDQYSTIIRKIPIGGGEQTFVTNDDISLNEITSVTNSSGDCLLIGLRLDYNNSIYYVGSIDDSGVFNDLFEVVEASNTINGIASMSANIDENDNYHILVTGYNGVLEIIFEEQTSIKRVKNNNILVYPNPVNNKIHIETDEKIEQVIILDVSGKVIIKTTKFVIDLSNQKAGTYFLQIKTDKGLVTKTIIVD